MRGWKLNREIDKLIEAREAYRAMLTSVTANPSGDVVQSTKDPHKEQIAVDECYNIRHVWRLHGEALKAAEPIVKERIHEEL